MDDPDWPRDEYDCLMGPLLTLLDSGASKEEIARYLRKEIDEHFGLSADNYDFTAVAERVRRWFDHGWRAIAEPVTIFVALLDEGVDVQRAVQARPARSRVVQDHWRRSGHKRRDMAVSSWRNREV